MSLTVVSFYTPQGDYPAHADRLVAECKALGMPYRIGELPDAGDYLANCRQKPFFIRQVLTELGSPILFIDVDSSLYARPELPGDVDFMARVKPEDEDRALSVGVLYFNFTPAALELVARWCDATGDWSDESSLDDVWEAGSWDGRFRPLEPEYFTILANPAQEPPEGTIVAIRLSRGLQKVAFQATGQTRPER